MSSKSHGLFVKQIVSVVLFLALVLPCAATSALAANSAQPQSKTASEIVREIRIGWNLGNALDPVDEQKKGINKPVDGGGNPEEYYQKFWGNPVTTKQMIDTVAKAGYGAIRVPVSYYDHMDDQFNIRKEWLDRVEEVVGYVLANDIYCIINVHHDNIWLKANPELEQEMKANFGKVWKQIAERFKDYDQRLIFEGFNEVLDKDANWLTPSADSLRMINTLNQTFVDTVRATGGKNTDRCLNVKPYAAAVDKPFLDAFVMPKDSVSDRLMLSVHVYTPFPFLDVETGNRPAAMRNPFYTSLNRLKEKFIDKGVPVMITEFGAKNLNNTTERVEYVTEFVGAVRKYGLACFWWDDGGASLPPDEVTNFALLDRRTNTWLFPTIVEAMVNAARSGGGDAAPTAASPGAGDNGQNGGGGGAGFLFEAILIGIVIVLTAALLIPRGLKRLRKKISLSLPALHDR